MMAYWLDIDTLSALPAALTGREQASHHCTELP
jgi:hypothetical protein